MEKKKEIELKEALSKVSYMNAVDFFTNHGIRGSENTKKIEFYTETLQKYLNFLQT